MGATFFMPSNGGYIFVTHFLKRADQKSHLRAFYAFHYSKFMKNENFCVQHGNQRKLYASGRVGPPKILCHRERRKSTSGRKFCHCPYGDQKGDTIIIIIWLWWPIWGERVSQLLLTCKQIKWISIINIIMKSKTFMISIVIKPDEM